MHGLYYPINLACDQQFLLVKTSFSFHPGNISFSLSLSAYVIVAIAIFKTPNSFQ